MQAEWKRKVEGVGGVFHDKIKKGICFIEDIKEICESFLFQQRKITMC